MVLGLAWPHTSVRADPPTTLTGNYEVTGTLSAGGSQTAANTTNTNTVSGNHAVGLGFNLTASGNASLATGYHTTASGNYSTALGYQSTASGNTAIAMGKNASAIGNLSVAIGESTTANMTNSVALGYLSSANANSSIVVGSNLTANSYASLVIGSLNAPLASQNATTWVGTDGLLILGNGNGTASNALLITKNGNMGVGNFTTAPTEVLEVKGRLRLDADGGGNVTSENGTLRWTGSALELRKDGAWTSLTGIANATTTLSLANGNASLPSLYTTSGNSTGIFSPGNNTLAITSSGQERLRVDSGGNVGIGTTSPSHTLEVAGTAQVSGVLTTSGGVDLANSTIKGLASGGNTTPSISFQSGNTTGIFSPVSGAVALTANGTERLRADSGGNVTVYGKTVITGTANITGNISIGSGAYGDIPMGQFGD